ncbi:MAG: acetolactate synthase small subunit [Anaerolineae bacterium]|nr:acetolactate synthase small subunit [Thermoflexales bacterium]MDW8406516.1 acetolactate synthase small subunit [Anaerolineae bacterium]
MLIDHAAAARQNKQKHTLVALVENKPGVLNRVASLFRRRNYNIDSLAVGTTDDPAVSRMTIVVDASKTSAALVESNLYKLVNVIDVQDLTNVPAVIREMALIKVRTNDAQQRGEIKQIADMYKSDVVDLSKDSIILEVTGDETKIDAMLNVLSEYGIMEVVRTGRIAMGRGATRMAQKHEATEVSVVPFDNAVVGQNGHGRHT